MDYYEILEVSKNASKEVIEKAYKTLVKKYHPDLYQGKAREKAEKKIKKLNEAYDILKDDEKRNLYNSTLENVNKESKEKFEDNSEINSLSNKEILDKFNQYDIVLGRYSEYIDNVNRILYSTYGKPNDYIESEEEIKEKINFLKNKRRKEILIQILKRLLVCIVVLLVFMCIPSVRELIKDIINFIKK